MCGVDVQWFQEICSQSLPSSKELSVEMTLGFLSGSKNFCKLTSPKFFNMKCSSTFAYSAWGLYNFGPFTDLTIAVFTTMSINTVLTQILWNVGSKNNSWEELACESPCSGISSSTTISLNSCSHSGISEYNGSPRSIVVSFLFRFGFYWLSFIRLPWSITNRSWHSHYRGVNFNSILSFSSHSITYCRWWRRAWKRCWTMTLMTWNCLSSWRIRSWRRTRRQAWKHNRNKVVRGFTVSESRS